MIDSLHDYAVEYNPITKIDGLSTKTDREY